MRSKYFAIIRRSRAYSPSAVFSGNHLNKCLFYTVKGIIHYIIVIGYRFSKLKVLLYIGINAVCHHFNGGFCHKTNIVAFLAGSAVKEGNDLGNILCLIADSFHIGNHFKGSGNHTKGLWLRAVAEAII